MPNARDLLVDVEVVRDPGFEEPVDNLNQPL
jgi:hypothetical protein